MLDSPIFCFVCLAIALSPVSSPSFRPHLLPSARAPSSAPDALLPILVIVSSSGPRGSSPLDAPGAIPPALAAATPTRCTVSAPGALPVPRCARRMTDPPDLGHPSPPGGPPVPRSRLPPPRPDHAVIHLEAFSLQPWPTTWIHAPRCSLCIPILQVEPSPRSGPPIATWWATVPPGAIPRCSRRRSLDPDCQPPDQVTRSSALRCSPCSPGHLRPPSDAPGGDPSIPIANPPTRYTVLRPQVLSLHPWPPSPWRTPSMLQEAIPRSRLPASRPGHAVVHLETLPLHSWPPSRRSPMHQADDRSPRSGSPITTWWASSPSMLQEAIPRSRLPSPRPNHAVVHLETLPLHSWPPSPWPTTWVHAPRCSPCIPGHRSPRRTPSMLQEAIPRSRLPVPRPGYAVTSPRRRSPSPADCLMRTTFLTSYFRPKPPLRTLFSPFS